MVDIIVSVLDSTVRLSVALLLACLAGLFSGACRRLRHRP